jgi:hypothetical protein
MSFILNTHYAIRCVVNFYNAGVVTRGRRTGSWGQCLLQWSLPVIGEYYLFLAENWCSNFKNIFFKNNHLIFLSGPAWPTQKSSAVTRSSARWVSWPRDSNPRSGGGGVSAITSERWQKLFSETVVWKENRRSGITVIMSLKKAKIVAETVVRSKSKNKFHKFPKNWKISQNLVGK